MARSYGKDLEDAGPVLMNNFSLSTISFVEHLANGRGTMIDPDSLANGVVVVVEEGTREGSITSVNTGDGVGVLRRTSS